MSKPSTDLTILGDKKGARVNMGDEKVIKKLEVVKQESCKRIRRLCVFLKNVIMVISGLLTWCVYELLKEASGKCSGGSNMPYFTLLNKRQ